MHLLLDLHITDTLCHCGGVFSAVVKWKRLSPSQAESVLVSLRCKVAGWVTVEMDGRVLKHNFLSLATCNCIHYILYIICNEVHNRRKRMKPSTIIFTVLLLVRTKAAAATKVILDWPQSWPCCGRQCSDARATVLATAHRDDITFLTPGSSPACKTVAEEVALFVLAAHRTSGMTRRWGALVWNIF